MVLMYCNGKTVLVQSAGLPAIVLAALAAGEQVIVGDRMYLPADKLPHGNYE